MRILSDPIKSVEFIHRLEDETVYSQAEFDKQKTVFDSAEKDLEEQLNNEDIVLIDKKIVSSHTANDLLDEILWQSFEMAEKAVNPKRKTPPHKIIPTVQAGLNKLQQVLQAEEHNAKGKTAKERRKFQETLRNYLADWIESYQLKKHKVFLSGQEIIV